MFRLIYLAFLFLFLALRPLGAAGTVLYQDDFDTLSGWTTDNANYHWQISNYRGYNHLYAYSPVTVGTGWVSKDLSFAGYDLVNFRYATTRPGNDYPGPLYFQVYDNGSWVTVGNHFGAFVDLYFMDYNYNNPSNITSMRFYCGFNTSFDISIDSLTIIGDRKPSLSFTGEVHYENTAVYPSTGSSLIPFNIRVEYTDADNDSPAAGYPLVMITSGAVVVKQIALNYESGAYTSGAIYSTTTLLNPCTFYICTFHASDGLLASSVLYSTGPYVRDFIVSGKVNDPGGSPMSNCSLSFTDGTTSYYTLSNASGDYSFIGAPYHDYTLNVSSYSYYSFSPSSYTFNNLSSDLTDQDFIRISSTPTLSWSGDTSFVADGVSPDSSTYTDTFYYKVCFTDPDNDPPASGYPKTFILSGGTTIQVLSMNYVSGSYSTGAIFSTSTLLSPCSSYSYCFVANDFWSDSFSSLYSTGPDVRTNIDGYVKDPFGAGMANVTMTLSGAGSDTCYTNSAGKWSFEGLIADRTYIITPSSFSYYSFVPATFTYITITSSFTNQIYTRYNSTNSASIAYSGAFDALNTPVQSTGVPVEYCFTYTDPDNDAPKVGFPRVNIFMGGNPITGSPFVMTYDSGVYRTGAVYKLLHTFDVKANDYSYSVDTFDLYNASSAAPGISNGPTIDVAPTISFIGSGGFAADYVNPDNGDLGTAFEWRFKYTDPDNDAPAAGMPLLYVLKDGSQLNDSPFLMQSVNTLDTVYSDGKEYFYSMPLPAGTDYSYYIQVADIWHSSFTTSVYPGPNVGLVVSGSVFDPLGNALSGIKLNLSGYSSQSTYTDDTGSYSFVITTNTYSISPSSSSFLSFYPSSYTYSNIANSLPDQNYTRNNSSPSFKSVEGYIYGINYQTAYTTDTVIFSLIYRDSENDPPAVNSLKVIIKSSNTVVSSLTLAPAGSDYRAGVFCSTGTSFGKVGHFTYTFEGNDKWNASITFDDIYNLNDLYFDIIDVPPSGFANTSQLAVNGGGVVSSKVVLSWNAADPGGGPVIYSLYISNDSTFFSPVKRNAPEIGSNMTCVYTGSLTSFSLENLPAGKTFYWQVMATNSRGASAVSPVWSFNTVSLAPTSTRNYPNPFNPSSGPTRIAFSSTKSQVVKLYIYSEIGDLIFTDDFAAVAGTNEYVYRGLDSAGNTLYNGTYICRIIKEDGIATCNLMVIK